MKQILKGFLVGASWPAFILFFRGFQSYQGKFNKHNCIKQQYGIEPYAFYSQIAPLYLGTMTAIAIAISKYFQISLDWSFLLVGVLSSMIVSFSITQCQVYNFTPSRLREQYLRLLLYHFVTYNVIIRNLYIAIWIRIGDALSKFIRTNHLLFPIFTE